MVALSSLLLSLSLSPCHSHPVFIFCLAILLAFCLLFSAMRQLLSDIEKLGCGCHTRAPKPISVSCVCRGAKARTRENRVSPWKQAPLLQTRSSLEFPRQTSDPVEFAFPHIRDRFCDPTPQLTLHSLHELHSPQLESETKHHEEKLIFETANEMRDWFGTTFSFLFLLLLPHPGTNTMNRPPLGTPPVRKLSLDSQRDTNQKIRPVHSLSTLFHLSLSLSLSLLPQIMKDT